MIYVDSILWGPEVGHLAVSAALHKLSLLVAEADRAEPVTLEFLYVIGGSLGEPEQAETTVVVASATEERVRLVVPIPSGDALSITTIAELLAKAVAALPQAQLAASWAPIDHFGSIISALMAQPGAIEPQGADSALEPWEQELADAKRELGIRDASDGPAD